VSVSGRCSRECCVVAQPSTDTVHVRSGGHSVTRVRCVSEETQFIMTLLCSGHLSVFILLREECSCLMALVDCSASPAVSNKKWKGLWRHETSLLHLLRLSAAAHYSPLMGYVLCSYSSWWRNVMRMIVAMNRLTCQHIQLEIFIDQK
jgi:hypothetical protein